MADAELATLAGRPGWTVDEAEVVAAYRPTEVGWSATIRRLPGQRTGPHRYDRWHVAVLDAAGRAQYAKATAYLLEARRIAEGMVDAQS